jgi:hypothetical protein
MLETWADEGLFDDPFLWRHTDLGEDIVAALLCYATGRKIRDFNSAGEPFGVQFQGLGFPVPELFQRGYGVVHSVKCENLAAEAELRRDLFGRLGATTAFA